MSVTKVLTKAGLLLKDHLPTILTVLGIGAGAMAVKSAYDSAEKSYILHEDEENISKVDYMEVSDAERREKKKEARKRWGIDFLKIHGKTLAYAALAVVLIVGGHKILLNQKTSYAALASTAVAGLTEYRSRVIEDLGKDFDEHIMKGTPLTSKNVETGEDGQSTTKVQHDNPAAYDTATAFKDYKYLYSESTVSKKAGVQFFRDPVMTMHTLSMKYSQIASVIDDVGFITINDALKILNLDCHMTEAGHVAVITGSLSFGRDYERWFAKVQGAIGSTAALDMIKHEPIYIELIPNGTIHDVFKNKTPYEGVFKR